MNSFYDTLDRYSLEDIKVSPVKLSAVLHRRPAPNAA